MVHSLLEIQLQMHVIVTQAQLSSYELAATANRQHDPRCVAQILTIPGCLMHLGLVQLCDL